MFLVSGGGGNLLFVHEAIQMLKLPLEIVGIISDRECKALSYGERYGIYSQKINYNKKDNSELKEELLQLNPDVIVTNFHKIIDDEVINLFNNKLINLHYSLLPSFGGLIGMKTIEAAKNKNSKFIGTTVHKVDEIVDNGTILAQSCFSINWENFCNREVIIEDTIFKSGCLSLLNILIADKHEDVGLPLVKLNDFEVAFSPAIRFNALILDEQFWNTIKLSTL